MKRNPFFDNAKFILIFFVVFGHMIEPVISTDSVIKTIYLSIYSFHMPAFVLVSGMLAKSEINQEYVLNSIKSVLLPFIVFTVLYEVFNFVVTGDISFYTKNLQPYWILWFLYSLFIWKMMLPIFLKVKYPLALSITLAVGAGYFESVGYFLGVSRTLYFFPFFILGYKLTSAGFMELKGLYNSKSYRSIFSAIIVLNILVFALFSDMRHEWLYGSFSYYRLGDEILTAGITRSLLLVISLATAFSVLMLIPVKSNQILSRGKNSLQVYVWHGFFIKVLAGSSIISIVGSYPTYISLLVFFVLSVLLTLVLSHGFIAKNTQLLIIGPVQSFVLKRFRRLPI